MKTIVGSKTLSFHNSWNVSAKIAFFEGRRVILKAQNRREEVRREDKQSFGRGASREKREEERRRAVEEDREVDKRRQAAIRRKLRGVVASPK